jgi:hypothetical protein
MKACITEVIEYEADVPEGVDRDQHSVEEWFVKQDTSKMKLTVRERTIEIIEESWKIQTASANGWADIKVSKDGENYHPFHFDSKSEAEKEMNDLATDHPDNYRVVTADTPQQDELYE